jgi:hypothetical protein
MTDKKKPLTVEFVPGCFDHFDGTQEELDELMAEIHRLVASGELEENSRELREEDFDDLPDDVKEQLIESFNDNTPKRNLQ